MERDHVVTTVDRVMRLLSRNGADTGQGTKGSEIRIVASDALEPHKMEIRVPYTSTLRIRRH
jgi:hypothetical protein